jgi:hypothetical protein
MDRETEERLAAMDARIRSMESAAADPWAGPPVDTGPPGPRPVWSGPTLLPDSVTVVFWGKILTKVGSGAYTFEEEVLTDGTTWTTLTGGRTGTCYEANDVAGIALGTHIKIRIEYDTSGTQRYVFNYNSANKVEGGTVPSAVIPAADKGWIYKYTRAGVVEDAHADPRNETVYKPPRACECITACDARGHTIGWWYNDVVLGDTWYSPWGFGNPGAPSP